MAYLAKTDVLRRRGTKQTGRFLVNNAEKKLLTGKVIPVNTEKKNIRVAAYGLRQTGTVTIEGVVFRKYDVTLTSKKGDIKISHELKNSLVQHFK